MKTSDLFSPYEWKARLFPAFLGLLAPGAVLGWLFEFDLSAVSKALPFASAAGLFFLVAAYIRRLGWQVEVRNFKRWGGKPSTQLLRHSDSSIDPITKSRYHQFLSEAVSRRLPSASEESRDPAAAGAVYESAVLWLRAHTSDTTQFKILFQENIAYGFARNGQALKPIAIALSLLSVLPIFVRYGVLSGKGLSIDRLNMVPTTGYLLIGGAVVSVLIWLSYFTEASTRRAGFAYAHALLRACDNLPRPPPGSQVQIITST